MAGREILRDLYWVGTIDWDREVFDELIPLPDGTSYNAYLVKGSEKTALIDSVDPVKSHELLMNLRELGVTKVDYVIANHGEQDHSGSIPRILESFPEARVVTNPKCKGMLMDLLLIPEEKFLMVQDGETLGLGGRTLKFIYAPWVHWPETMLTYLIEDRMLFSCDLFGTHLATSDLFFSDECKLYEAAKRYYAEIMMPFASHIRKHLDNLAAVPVAMIGPSHGPVHRKPEFIMNAYREWVYGPMKKEVVLAYVSMHDSTRKMAEYLIDALLKRGVKVIPFNLTKVDTGALAMSLVDAATLVVASPTVLAGPHPAAAYGVLLANALRPSTKHVAIIGSYGWGGKMVETLTGLAGNLKAEILPPVLVKGFPREENLQALDALAEEIQKRHETGDLTRS